MDATSRALKDLFRPSAVAGSLYRSAPPRPVRSRPPVGTPAYLTWCVEQLEDATREELWLAHGRFGWTVLYRHDSTGMQRTRDLPIEELVQYDRDPLRALSRARVELLRRCMGPWLDAPYREALGALGEQWPAVPYDPPPRVGPASSANPLLALMGKGAK